ncbi:hypothetical protein LIS90_13195 [Flavobacterium psychrophilum]|uniref:hypothetical protein n=1 Tax=Flavobacterium psychrophilum TaxID=96345 RepID=UPI001D070F1E|nr:hypothetical protein [Flavobacterium psychrophilum]MCB6232201.1 hypothetical protein [Flavobacterium psychrophilum]
MSAKCSWCGKVFDGDKALYLSSTGTAVGKTISALNWLTSDSGKKKQKGSGIALTKKFCSRKCITFFNDSRGELQQQNFQEKPIQQVPSIDYDAQLFRIKKEAEFKSNVKLHSQSMRNEEIKKIKDDIENGDNKILGYFRIIWTYLDTWWKKAIFIYVIFLIISQIATFFGLN